MSLASNRRSRRGLSVSGPRSVSPPLSPTLMKSVSVSVIRPSGNTNINLPAVLSYTHGEFNVPFSSSPEKDRTASNKSSKSGFSQVLPYVPVHAGGRGKRSPGKLKGKGRATLESWAKETADERMLRNTGFLSELLQGKVSLDGAGSADAQASPYAMTHASALRTAQPMTEMLERQITRGMTARTKFNRDTYTTLMASSQTPIETPLEGYAQQKVHGVPMTYSQSVHPTVGRGGTLTRYSSTGTGVSGGGYSKAILQKGNRSFTRLRPLILQHEPTTLVAGPLDRSIDGLFNGLGPAGKRRRLQTSPIHRPDDGAAMNYDGIEFYPTPVNKLTHDLLVAVEKLLKAKNNHPEGKAFILPAFVEVAQTKCVDCILLRAGGGYFRLGVPKDGTCTCFKCGQLLDFDVRTNTHLTRGKMRHVVARMGHPHGDDDAELMARRAADWLTAEELAMSEEEAARQMEELDRLKMMQAMAVEKDGSSSEDQLQGWNLFKPLKGETTKEWMERMQEWATTRHVGETEEEFQARIAKWLERQPGETDEEYSTRMRAYHKRKEGESQATYWSRLSKLMRFDMSKLKEISSQWETLEDAEEALRKKEEAEIKQKSRRLWGLVRQSVVKSLPSMEQSSKLFELVKMAREAHLRDVLKSRTGRSGGGSGANNWNKLRHSNAMWHAKKTSRKTKAPASEGMLNAVNVQLTDLLDEAVEEAVRIAIAEVQEENAMLAVIMNDVVADMVQGIANAVIKAKPKKKRRAMPKRAESFALPPGTGGSAGRRKQRANLFKKIAAADPAQPAGNSMIDYLSKYALVGDDRLSFYQHIFNEYDQAKSGFLDASNLSSALGMIVDKGLDIDEILEILCNTLEIKEIQGADFKLFTIFAALIEKIVSFEKHIDINQGIGKRELSVAQKLGLQIKRAKHLFYMCDFDPMEGTVPIAAIEHEINSGGMKEDETATITDALYARGLANFTFIDFLDYVPFFNSLHDKIVVSGFHGGKSDEEKAAEKVEQEVTRQRHLSPQEKFEPDAVYKERLDGLVRDALEIAELKEKTMKASLGHVLH